jgi:hypothetical protein
MMMTLAYTEGSTMKRITTCLLFGTAFALAGCGNMSSTGAGTGGAGGTARTVSGADAANADVKGSTSQHASKHQRPALSVGYCRTLTVRHLLHGLTPPSYGGRKRALA